MNEEMIKQRVKYLVEHGGIYPTTQRDWIPVATVIAAVVLVELTSRLLL